MLTRTRAIKNIEEQKEFDILVIGGGASGIGAAYEASLRGHKVLLVEKHDFTKGTSSKSTKLIHGGVRYMAQGDLGMVREALKERGHLLRNAPHIVHNQSFIIPNYRWWEGVFYTIGLKFYDLLAGKWSLGKSLHLGRKKAGQKLEGIKKQGLRGGVLYHDGQFDDSRLAMDLLQQVESNAGLFANYLEVIELHKGEDEKILGALLKDHINNKEIKVSARAIINATGVWADEVLRMDEGSHENLIRPSQGIHLVLGKEFFPGEQALMIPKTSDGRVLFAVPWHDHVVIGTTDTPVNEPEAEPAPLQEEIDFILETAANYFEKTINRTDVLSVFAGLRPLAAPKQGDSKTKEISRNHKIVVSKSGLITVIGGKWTTFRKMGQDMIDKAAELGQIPLKKSNSLLHHFHGDVLEDIGKFKIYGSNAENIKNLAESTEKMGQKIHPNLPYTWAEIDWMSKNEMVVHLEDLLSRRTRSLLLNARASMTIAEEVANFVAPILAWDQERIDDEVKSFRELAKLYVL